MHIVAIYNLPDHKDDLAEALAAALGTTLYEARSRLRVPGKGPLVGTSCRDREAAEKIVERLASGGFDAIVLGQDEIETESAQFIVRKFRLNDEALDVESGGFAGRHKPKMQHGDLLAIDAGGRDMWRTPPHGMEEVAVYEFT